MLTWLCTITSGSQPLSQQQIKTMLCNQPSVLDSSADIRCFVCGPDAISSFAERGHPNRLIWLAEMRQLLRKAHLSLKILDSR